jgi:glycerol-3-phosphate cytidylyltransferase|nr:MAG TPA: rfaE bifunctional protein, domain II [Caudoviricetes sp.]
MFDKLEKIRKFKTIGFTASTFDLLHAGHVIMLEEAKSQVDFLVVGLLTDPTISRPEKNKPVQSILERYIQLQAVKCVDMIVPFDTEEDLVNLIKIVRPHLRFCGEEYKDVEHTGKHIPGVKIIYNSRQHDFSSSSLRERVKNG